MKATSETIVRTTAAPSQRATRLSKSGRDRTSAASEAARMAMTTTSLASLNTVRPAASSKQVGKIRQWKMDRSSRLTAAAYAPSSGQAFTRRRASTKAASSEELSTYRAATHNCVARLLPGQAGKTPMPL